MKVKANVTHLLQVLPTDIAKGLEGFEIEVPAFTKDYKGSQKDFLRENAKAKANKEIFDVYGGEISAYILQKVYEAAQLVNAAIADYSTTVALSTTESEAAKTQEGELNAVASDIKNAFEKYPYFDKHHTYTAKEYQEKVLEWWSKHKEEELLKAALSENPMLGDFAKMWLNNNEYKANEKGEYTPSEMLIAVKAIKAMTK